MLIVPLASHPKMLFLHPPWKFGESLGKKSSKRARFLSCEKTEQLHIYSFTEKHKPSSQKSWSPFPHAKPQQYM